MTTHDDVAGAATDVEVDILGDDEAEADVETVADVLVEDDGTVVDLEDGDDDLDATSDEPAAAIADRQPAGGNEPAGAGSPGDEDPLDSLLPDDPDADADEAGDGEGPLEVIDAEDLLEEEAEEPEISPYDRPGRWYVVHTQSGYENKVSQNLEARIGSMNMEGRIHEVVIPVEDVVEFKGGRKVVVPRKVFPGYLLVRCQLDDDSWYVIRNTPGVTGFVGRATSRRRCPAGTSRRSSRCARAGDRPPSGATPPGVRARRDGAGQGRPLRRLLR